ncbi:ribosomal protein L28 [Paraphysoderma sedebokerense]|nr:ribosomal protein L28 [Paraphysoderma sedebokerense]
MSSELIWQLVRNNNAFLVKKNGVQFSAEPNNLTNKNSFKYSGLANPKTVGVVATADKRGVTFTTKKTTSSNKPAKMFATVSFTRGTRRSVRSANGILKTYRPDLKKAALARISAYNRKPMKVKSA